VKRRRSQKRKNAMMQKAAELGQRKRKAMLLRTKAVRFCQEE